MAESGVGLEGPPLSLSLSSPGHGAIRLMGQAFQEAAEGLGYSHANRSGEERTRRHAEDLLFERVANGDRRVWPREAGSGPRTGVWHSPTSPQFSTILMLSTKKEK